ncbi:MAG: KH domain-containing protein [Clostridia bacterium]|nr:KH domain-containing protein [Clostridia bacterium]
MIQTIEVKGKSIEACIEKGLVQLGLTDKNQVDVEVIKDNGILFNKYTLRISTKQSLGEKAEEYLDQLLKLMGLSFTIDVSENDDRIYIELIGIDGKVVIGRRGEVLDALQLLTGLAVNTGKDDYKRITIDSENYRKKREESLVQLAKSLENKCKRLGRKIKLEPMNPYERLVIHSALQDSEFVTTMSEGVAPNRFVVIHPKFPAQEQRVGKRKSSKEPHKKHSREDEVNDKPQEPTVRNEQTDALKPERKQLNIVYSSSKKRR